MKFKGVHLLGRPLGLILIAGYELFSGIGGATLGALALLLGYVITGELAEDPSDLFIHWLLDKTPFTLDASHRIGIALLLLGLFKIAVAYGIWLRSWKIRKVMIALFCGVTLASAVDFAFKPGVLNAFILCVDLGVVYYLWRVLPRHLAHSRDAIGA